MSDENLHPDLEQVMAPGRHPTLDKVDDPDDLKALDRKELRPLCEELRHFIRDLVSVTGGHMGSNLGAVELTVGLHRTFDFLKDRLIWDVSHQAYPHKILTGRKSRMPTIKKWGGLCGFTDSGESPYDVFRCAHAGTAIATATGMALADKREGRNRRIAAFVGDGSLCEGMAFEAINYAGTAKPDVLVVLNDNEWSISQTVGALSTYLSKVRGTSAYREMRTEVQRLLEKLPAVGGALGGVVESLRDALRSGLVPGHVFEELGWRYYGPIDGNDVDAVVDALEDLKDAEGPVILHALTQKGLGLPEPEKRHDRYHAFSAKKPETPKVQGSDRAAHGTPTPKWTKVFSDALIALAEDDPRIVAINAAMPDGTGTRAFEQVFPGRYHDVGIAEQAAVGIAAGFAEAGMRPVAAIYSTFLQRAYDQVFHEVALQGLPVIFCMDRSGLVGGDGWTTHGLLDIAYMRILPGFTVMAPKNADELDAMLRLAAQSEGPTGIRYPRGTAPDRDFGEGTPVRLGEAEVLRRGDGPALLAYGAMADQAMEAADVLAEDGVDCTVVNARFAKPLDRETLLPIVADAPCVLTIEEHQAACGFGSAVLEACAAEGVDASRVHVCGVPDRWIPHGGRGDQLRDCGLDPAGLVERARAALDGRAPAEVSARAGS